MSTEHFFELAGATAAAVGRGGPWARQRPSPALSVAGASLCWQQGASGSGAAAASSGPPARCTGCSRGSAARCTFCATPGAAPCGACSGGAQLCDGCGAGACGACATAVLSTCSECGYTACDLCTWRPGDADTTVCRTTAGCCCAGRARAGGGRLAVSEARFKALLTHPSRRAASMAAAGLRDEEDDFSEGEPCSPGGGWEDEEAGGPPAFNTGAWLLGAPEAPSESPASVQTDAGLPPGGRHAC
jgi:hypothetical protein